ncbi:MAG: glycosyltransferase [Candidatus Cloacimonetes bacterium]|nr:glycosyltransferase [Candidatus Cloacimonadota bacterium]
MDVVRIIARLNVGGPAKHVAWLSSGLQKKSWTHKLLHGVIDGDEDDLSTFSKNLSVDCVQIDSLEKNISFKDIKAFIDIFLLLLKHSPKVLHTHTSKAGFLGRAAGLVLNVLRPWSKMKIVHTFHGHTFHGYFSLSKERLFLNIEKFLAKFASHAIVTISKQQQQEIRDQFKVGHPSKHHLISLGIDTDFANRLDKTALKQRLNIPDDSKVFGIVGRIAPIKNHRLFIESVAEFHKINDQNISFVIVGGCSDQDMALLKDYSQSLGVNSIIFAGNVKTPEEIYGALDYLVLTSKNEGTPVSILEAFASKIPVASTSVGGVIDIVGSNNDRGLLCDQNAKELASLYHHLLTEDNSTRVDKAHQFVHENYSIDNLVNKMDDLYKSLT